ncbi:MAG: M3 family metallopeptidase [Pseudomonadota bacterium]|nr:M3 family metallopeptidase [Pseudomonadota bacterium]
MHNPRPPLDSLPRFSEIDPARVEADIEGVLQQNRAAIDAVSARIQQGAVSWDDLIPSMDACADRLERAFSPVAHLNSVSNSEALRAAYNAVLPKLSAYASEVGQNPALYAGYRHLAGQSPGSRAPAEQRLLEQAVRDFLLSGIELGGEQQRRYRALQARLSELASRFSDQLLDATDGWSLTVQDRQRLTGIPTTALEAAERAAVAAGEAGYRLTLEFPCYQAVMTYAEDRGLREAMYSAYVTRASDQGPGAGRWDNGPVMEEILNLRAELAALLGYPHYAALSLATKMNTDADAVEAFLLQLAARSKAQAQREWSVLCAFAATRGCADLQPWDQSFYSEQLRQAEFDLSQEALRPYFPLPKVLAGLFEITGRLFGFGVEEIVDFDRWHPDARLFALHRPDGLVGHFYLDLHARPQKRGGAWMADYAGRRRLPDGTHSLPVAFLVCNFPAPTAAAPALLSHQEVTTLFHEFGHGLHHLLTRMEWLPVSGINGVPWDAVELPSQLMENWCWTPEGLGLMSGHHQTGEALPDATLERLRAARGFQAGLQMLRQLEFALFDLRLHSRAQGACTAEIQATLDQVRSEVAVAQPPHWNRFQHGFSHIFAGGYAAGYFSYKWAEVLSADAFSRFEEEGILNPAVGEAFAHAVLEAGGGVDPADAFLQFRGRPPQLDALLRHSGIVSEEAGVG